MDDLENCHVRAAKMVYNAKQDNLTNKQIPEVVNWKPISDLADLAVSKRPGTSNRIEIHFAIFNHLYLCFSFMKFAETL